MLNLRVVQAQHGDCFLLEYGTPAEPKYILVDGGPADVYQAHLKPVLEAIPARDRLLQRVILSHVDDDHIQGALDLMQELSTQRERRQRPTVAVQELWHNTFSTIVDLGLEGLGAERPDLLCGVLDLAPDLVHLGEGEAVRPPKSPALESIDQGDELTDQAGSLTLPINHDFRPERLISAEGAPRPVPEFEGLNLYVLGPSGHNLGKLQVRWQRWLTKHLAAGPRALESDLREAEPVPKPDESVFNLSSIMLLAETDGKRVLLTGDGLGKHLIQGLEGAGMLAPGEAFHVDVLKLPHHGSARNVSPGFFRRVTADQYVISANGRDGNPDLLTLKWLVEAAREQGRDIEIVITNWTRSICELMRARDPDEYGYRLVAMDPGDHSMVLRLVD
jgi:hypothetical protein